MIDDIDPRWRDVQHLTRRRPNHRGVRQRSRTTPARSRRVRDRAISRAALQRRSRRTWLLARWAIHAATGIDARLLACFAFLGPTHPTITTITRRRRRGVPRVLPQPRPQLSVLRPQRLDLSPQLDHERFELGDPRVDRHAHHSATHRANTNGYPRPPRESHHQLSSYSRSGVAERPSRNSARVSKTFEKVGAPARWHSSTINISRCSAADCRGSCLAAVLSTATSTS